MQSRIIIFSILISIFLNACDGIYSCPEPLEKKYFLFDKTKKIFENYRDKKKAIFTDSLGNIEVYDISFENDYYEEIKAYLEGDCERKYISHNEYIRVFFSHKIDSISFRLGGTYVHTDKAKYDLIVCSRMNNQKSFFSYTINDAKSEVKTQDIIIYNKIYPTIISENETTLFYCTEKSGIVAIRIPGKGNKLWILEKLE